MSKKLIFFLLFLFLGLSCTVMYRQFSDSEKELSALQKQQLIESNLTLLVNQNNTIPIPDLSNRNFILLSSKSSNFTSLFESMSLYTKIEKISFSDAQDCIKKLKNQQNHSQTSFILALDTLNEDYLTLSNYLKNEKLIVSFFAPAEQLSSLTKEQVNPISALILAHQKDSLTQSLTGQLIFGGLEAEADLPNDISALFLAGQGFKTKKIRLKYTIPEELKINKKKLAQVDTLIREAMEVQAMAGSQVLIAKEGKVFYHKSFGFHTYDSLKTVKLTDLYDLASVTKISSALPALMKLHGQNKFHLDSAFSNYFSPFKNTNKDTLKFREILAHHAQLQSYYHFQTNKRGKSLVKKFFKKKKSKKFPIQVADNFYIHKNFYKKHILKRILKSPLRKNREYKYSGLAFLLLPEVIDSLAGLDYELYLQENFYKPLGANSLCFNPKKHFSLEQIIPTQKDSTFRNQTVHGYVHDPSAAMLGGVSANAGLFSNANDLAKLMQMYLQKGEYGGERFIKSSSVDEFTKCQFCQEDNRRGLGFDKPMIDWQVNGNTAEAASPESFGHSGYTGTFVWADPKNDLLYIFLTNRTYPSSKNIKLYELNTRTRIQEAIYEAL